MVGVHHNFSINFFLRCFDFSGGMRLKTEKTNLARFCFLEKLTAKPQKITSVVVLLSRT